MIARKRPGAVSQNVVQNLKLRSRIAVRQCQSLNSAYIDARAKSSTDLRRMSSEQAFARTEVSSDGGNTPQQHPDQHFIGGLSHRLQPGHPSREKTR